MMLWTVIRLLLQKCDFVFDGESLKKAKCKTESYWCWCETPASYFCDEEQNTFYLFWLPWKRRLRQPKRMKQIIYLIDLVYAALHPRCRMQCPKCIPTFSHVIGQAMIEPKWSLYFLNDFGAIREWIFYTMNDFG